MRSPYFQLCNRIVLNATVICYSFILLQGCNSTSNLDEVDTQSRLKETVAALTDSTMEGRETGTAGERLAGNWIADQFEKAGLTVRGDSGAFQQFSYKPHPPMQMHGSGDSLQLGMAVVKEIIGQNVLHSIESSCGTHWGVIGAHYDHLGYGDENSLFRGEPTIHFGADDNASGVAGMIELAQRMKNHPIGHSLLFAAFSGEEKGLWGSNYYCEHPTIPLDSVRFMINFDMIGRLRGDTLAVYGTGTSPGWMELLEACNEDSLILVPSESGVGPSDHTSFYLEDIPVLHFFTGQHPDYHKPTDTADKIDYEGIEKIVNFVERVVRKLSQESSWEFTATKDEDEESTPSFKVTLGVVPDYLFSGQGMRIDGLTEGRPASNAGMKRGDVVTAIDTIQVIDMMTYMKALGQFEAGDTSLVQIQRDGNSEILTVTWD
ncbi:MAG: M28 family peptidase [Bacteroidetes bacterium]|nr:M28 family peptidase [Bacteroidota bacterium]MDA1336869.1 M28 family peptidase [Bacteroidota bacterium]